MTREIKQKEPFNTQYFKEYYEGYRNSFDDLFPSEKRFISDFVESKKTILDVGCAIGGMYEIVSSICPEVDYTGIDVADELVQIAKQRFPDVRFEVSDGVDLPFSEREFDRVLTLGTTVHDPLYEDLLSSCYRVCSEYLLFDIRLTPSLPTLNQVERAYVLDGSKKKYPYVVVSWDDFNYWVENLADKPEKISIYGYWGRANDDTILPSEYKKVCMACVLLKKASQKNNCQSSNKLEIQLDMPKEFSL
tara:strand:- start:110 stop:853 length:744 start_codon:yes stop_codon:yes gene_type:complete